MDTGPKGLAGGSVRGSRKSEEIIEISCDSPLHPLGWSLVDYHGPVWKVKGRLGKRDLIDKRVFVREESMENRKDCSSVGGRE